MSCNNIRTYSMKTIAPTISEILKIDTPAEAKGEPIKEVVNDLKGVERVAILAIDALGYKAFDKFKHIMPCMTSFIGTDKLIYLRSILPSITRVNFACMVAGTEMDIHGIKTSSTNDFTCETLFDTLKTSGKRSAGLGRNTWTGDMLLGRYADFSAEGKATNDCEVEQYFNKIVNDKMPEFIIIQYSLVDEVSHLYGPYSEQAGEAIAKADEWLSRCIYELKKYKYGTIILSDHGQYEYKKEDGTTGGDHGKDIDEACIVPMTWARL